jgi:DNA-binding NtrC family response regulator
VVVMTLSPAPTVMAILDEAGYEVESVRFASAAARMMQQRSYALVLTDWKLGTAGERGVAVADMAVSKGMRAIILSAAAADIPEHERARHEVLQKPVRAAELIRAVERHIGPATA